MNLEFCVEFDGQLLAVNMYFGLNIEVGKDVDGFVFFFFNFLIFRVKILTKNRIVWFRLFVLDWKGKSWVEVKRLGDRVLFLGDGCFICDM